MKPQPHRIPLLQDASTVPSIILRATPLLIERYLARYLAKHQSGELLDKAQKYLWMQSACFMTEALSRAFDGNLVQMPHDSTYIELEQPRHYCGYQVAAFALLGLAPVEHRRIQRWQVSLIDAQGDEKWLLLYEYDTSLQRGAWALPKGYQCPTRQCTIEHTSAGGVYTLCETCQQRITYYTSWIAVALKMIAGDFQEQIELREPEIINEVATRDVSDPDDPEQVKQNEVLHRYRVMRYLDACVYKGSEPPKSRRGSWMNGRPLAENEYEINPDAIIYVQIVPREHDRVYRDQRFVKMRGKMQHIEPKPRLQPMTIATYQQRRQHVQRITRVLASKYERAQENT